MHDPLSSYPDRAESTATGATMLTLHNNLNEAVDEHTLLDWAPDSH
jgi:hypothetical protein